MDLVLWFTPDAIREHFDGDEAFAVVADADDETLTKVGEFALYSDRLYKVFHQLLVDGLIEEGLA